MLGGPFHSSAVVISEGHAFSYKVCLRGAGAIVPRRHCARQAKVKAGAKGARTIFACLDPTGERVLLLLSASRHVG